MVSGSGGAEAAEGPAGNRGCAEASIFLKYQTDTFSLDAEDHWAGWEENGKFAQKKSERNHSKWQAEFSVVKKKEYIKENVFLHITKTATFPAYAATSLFHLAGHLWLAMGGAAF